MFIIKMLYDIYFMLQDEALAKTLTHPMMTKITELLLHNGSCHMKLIKII